MQIWYFRNSVSWEWAKREGRGGRPESGEQMLSIVGVTVRPLLVGTQYKILCVKMMLLLLMLLFFLCCACCRIFQIVLQLKWFEPPLNSCQSCHRKQFTIPKGPSQHNQMGPYTRNLSNCPALLWFLIWQSIDSSFGKHKQTLSQKTVQKVSNNLAKTMRKAYFPFPIHSRSHNHSHIPLNSVGSDWAHLVFQHFNARSIQQLIECIWLRNQKLKPFNLLQCDHLQCYKRALIVGCLCNKYISYIAHKYVSDLHSMMSYKFPHSYRNVPWWMLFY